MVLTNLMIISPPGQIMPHSSLPVRKGLLHPRGLSNTNLHDNGKLTSSLFRSSEIVKIIRTRNEMRVAIESGKEMKVKVVKLC